MIKAIYPKSLSGHINIPASKSQAHRLLICAALDDSPTDLYCDSPSEDIAATINCLNSIGADISTNGNLIHVKSGIYGLSDTKACQKVLNCNESGSTLRFLLPLVCALGYESDFTGCARLAERPLSPLYEELVSHGIELSPQGSFPLHTSGTLNSGCYTIRGDVSSQFITGLLMSLVLLPGDSTIIITGELESYSYVNMTINCLKQFGIIIYMDKNTISIPGNQRYHGPSFLHVEGDWSNGAFWLCAGAICNEQLSVGNLSLTSCQGDKAVIDILRSFGANFLIENNTVTCLPVEYPLHAIDINASNIPDLVPVLSIVAACANGKTHITHASRLRLKESDRLHTTSELIYNLGGHVKELSDSLEIDGGTILTGGSINSYNDHRIAMSAAVASCLCNNRVIITCAEAVNKSYPRFWSDFAALGAKAADINN